MRSSRRPSRCCRRSKAWRSVRRSCKQYVVPLTVIILVGLFAVQSRGTARVAALLRAGDDAVVHLPSPCVGHRPHRRRPGGVRRSQPDARDPLPRQPRLYRPRDARRRVPRRHRRRGALCRSRPFRPQADPTGLALPRAAGAGAQLFRPGRARACTTRRPIDQPVLPHGAGLGALSR